MPDYQAWFVDNEFNEDGEPNYPEAVGGRYDGGSSSYGDC